MKNFAPAIYTLSLFLSACAGSNADDEADNGSKRSKRPCKAHTDCEDDEVCYPKQGCVFPWGREFALKDVVFDGPSKSAEDECSIHGRWFPEQESNDSIQFKKGNWSEAAFQPWYRARPDADASLVIDFFHDDDHKKCPSHHKEGPLCLSGACEPFSVEHYRGEKKIKLSNITGDHLTFRLVPQKRKR